MTDDQPPQNIAQLTRQATSATRTIHFRSSNVMWATIHDMAQNDGVALHWDEPVWTGTDYLITIHATFAMHLLQDLGIDPAQPHLEPSMVSALIDAMIDEAAAHISDTSNELGIHLDEPETPLSPSGRF